MKYIESVPRPGAYRINAREPEKEEEEGNSSQLLCLKKSDCLTNSQNTVDLSNVHTRSVRFLEVGGVEGRRERRGRSAVWKHNLRIRETGKKWCL